MTDLHLPDVILLNGPGSVGKTSIARCLQEILPECYLLAQVDTFMEMLPPSSWDTPEGVWFEVLEADGERAVRAASGPAAERTLLGMREAVAAMVSSGNRVIVDEVAEADVLDDYRQVLMGHDILWVGLTASLSELERRERLRGDRHLGLARWQHERVHEGINYDLVIDTTECEADQVAHAIKHALGADRSTSSSSG
jgi:chloramphenicol 3-O phosphotransferase